MLLALSGHAPVGLQMSAIEGKSGHWTKGGFCPLMSPKRTLGA